MQHSIIFTGNTSISNHHFRAVGLLNIEEAETSPIDWILTLLRHFMIFLVNTWLLWLWYEEVWKIFVQRFFHSCHSSTISQITFQGVLIYNCFFFFICPESWCCSSSSFPVLYICIWSQALRLTIHRSTRWTLPLLNTSNGSERNKIIECIPNIL